MKIAEFFAVLTLKGGKESVQTMQGLVKSSMAAKVALIGAATALYKMSDAARKSAVFMDMYQLTTGLSTEQLQELSFKASQAGVSMTELGQAIKSLQQKSANARLGYGWDPVLTRFGLHPGQDPVTQLRKIGNEIKRLQATNPAEARALAAKAGIGDGMYYAILRGSTEQMNKQLILTQKEQQALVKLNMQWGKFWFYLKQIIIKIQALGAAFQTGVVKVLTRAIQGFYELFLRVYKVIEASDKLKIAIAAVGAAFVSAFAPELLLLGALVLILDDIFGYFNGEDSVTGKIVEWCKQSEEFKGLWEGISDVFTVFVELIKMAYNGWGELISVLKETGFLSDMLGSIVAILRSFIDAVLMVVKIPGVKKMLNAAGYGHIADIAENRLGKEEDFMAGAWDQVIKPVYTGLHAVNEGLTANTNVYIQGTGNVAQDTANAMDARRAVIEANAQQGNVSEGNVDGGVRYGMAEE